MEPTVTPMGDDLYLIDALMHDDTERLACYLFDTPNRVLIECGPSRSIHHLYDALESIGIDDVAAMVVTHIHLDHAGGAGHFAERFPGAKIGVHSAGARHLASPERLIASATRIYGEEGMASLWGPMEPIDKERIFVLEEGTEISLGGGRAIEVMYTPGHAKHEVVYVEEQTGGAFVGDAVGLAFPHGHMVQPVTPPPDFDPLLVETHLRRLGEREPAFLGFAHFGLDRDPQASLDQAVDRLWDWVRWVESADDDEDLSERMRQWVLEGYRREGYDEETIAIYDKNTFWPMQAAGIRRWLATREG
ncbi:MAG TPA: MBL fold metallo-hydrolase [Acidimicrobiia bacterium]|nr:MBL fold metallo-hydrolase [Acidimicrobiia bacterium]